MFASVVLVPKNWCKWSPLVRLLISRKAVSNWIQKHFRYIHGFGMDPSPVETLPNLSSEEKKIEYFSSWPDVWQLAYTHLEEWFGSTLKPAKDSCFLVILRKNFKVDLNLSFRHLWALFARFFNILRSILGYELASHLYSCQGLGGFVPSPEETEKK